jgi:uncharacterized protein YgbK (DUF1537 family)
MHAQLEQIVQQRDVAQQRLQELQQQAEDAKSAVAAATTARDQAQQRHCHGSPLLSSSSGA